MDRFGIEHEFFPDAVRLQLHQNQQVKSNNQTVSRHLKMFSLDKSWQDSSQAF